MASLESPAPSHNPDLLTILPVYSVNHHAGSYLDWEHEEGRMTATRHEADGVDFMARVFQLAQSPDPLGLVARIVTEYALRNEIRGLHAVAHSLQYCWGHRLLFHEQPPIDTFDNVRGIDRASQPVFDKTWDGYKWVLARIYEASWVMEDVWAYT